MNKVVKNSLRIFLITLASLLLLCVILVLVAGSPLGEGFIKNIIEKNVSKTLSMTVSIEEFRTNVFSHIKINSLNIYCDPPSSMSSLSVSSIEVHYNIFALISNKLSISEILIKGLDATLLRDKDGIFLLPELPAAKEPSKKTLQLVLGKIELTNSSISYDDQAIPLDATIRDFLLTLTSEHMHQTYGFIVQFNSAAIQKNDQMYGIENFAVSGTISSDVYNISDISFSSKGMTCSGSAEVHITKQDTKILANITIDGDPSEYVQIFGKDLPDKLRLELNNITLDVHVDGTPSKPNIGAVINIPDVRAEEINLKNTTITLSFESDSLRIKNLSTEVFGGTISARGWLETQKSESYQTELQIANIDYSQLWDFLYDNESPYSGSINGSLHASGEMNAMLSSSLSGNIKLGSLVFHKKRIDPLGCTFAYKEGKASLRVTQGLSSIESDLSIHDSLIRGTAKVTIDDIKHLAGLFNIPDAAGAVFAEADFNGSLDNPSVRATIKGKGLSYMNVPLDSLYADVSYVDSSLMILKSSFKGALDSLEPLAQKLMGEQIKGRVQYAGSLTGSMEDFSGSLTIHADSVQYRDFSVPVISVLCRAKNSDVTIDQLHIKTDKISCDAQGDVSVNNRSGSLTIDFTDEMEREQKHLGTIQTNFILDDMMTFDAQLKDISLTMLGAVSDSLTGVQGDISGSISFKGDLQNPTGSIQLAIDKPSYKDIFIDAITLQGQLTPSEFILSSGLVQLFNNDIRFRGKLGLDRYDGNITISPRCSIQGEVSMTDVALADFAEEFLDAVQTKGIVTASGQVGGTLGNPQINGSLRIKDGFVQLDSHKSPIENLSAIIIFADSTLNINKFTGLYEKKNFSFSGSVTSRDWRAISTDIALSINGLQAITVKGNYKPEGINVTLNADDFDVSFVEVVPAIMNAQGLMNASIHVLGSPQNPRLRGWLKASDLELLMEDIPIPLTKCMLDITATDERFDINTLSCKFGDGTISSKGYVSYTNNTISDIALNIHAEDISFREPKKFQVLVKSIDMKYSQQKTGYQIDGTIILGKTKYLEDVQISKVLASIGKPKIFKKPSPVMMQTKLNIRVTESKDIWVENNLARIRAKADITVIGTLAQPNIAGRLEITDGYIVYLDRKFNITRGVLDFTDSNMINPILDIQAETDIKNYSEPDVDPYHIIFAVTGPADKAKISLQSVPALDEANILSLLTFGTTRDQIFTQDPDKYDTSLKNILLERAEQYSSQKISGFVASRMAQMFDLDDVSIEGNLFKFGDSWGPQLVASKQLSKRMKVTYSTRIGYMNEQSIELDYKLTDHFYLQGQADQDGNAGIDVIYRMNFK